MTRAWRDAINLAGMAESVNKHACAHPLMRLPHKNSKATMLVSDIVQCHHADEKKGKERTPC
jgi:hypothetical protein